jgi:hypothetical protein
MQITKFQVKDVELPFSEEDPVLGLKHIVK